MTVLENVTITIQFFDSNNTLVSGSEQCSIDNTTKHSSRSIPDNVEKITLRAYFDEQKNITVTLYVKYKSSSGTILVQGKGCPRWAEKEFPLLGTIITNTISSDDFSWREAVQALPMHVDSDAPVMLLPSVPEREVHSVPTQELSAAQPDDNGQTAVKQRYVLSPRQKKRHQRRQITVISPAHTRARTRAKLSHDVSVSVVNRLTQLQLDLEELSTNQLEFQTQVKCLSEDIKTSTKNELRPIITTKIEDTKQSIAAMASRVANLEQLVTQLQKENQSLKTQVGTLQSNIKKLKPKSVADADTQTHHTAVTVSQQAPLPSSPAPLSTSNEAKQGSTQSVAPTTPTPPPEAHHEYTISTSNTYSALAEDEMPVKRNDSQSESTHHEPASLHSSMTNKKRSPQEQLSTVVISKHVNAVLIGDATIKTIDSTRLSQRKHVCQKVCVPDLTVCDVHTWLCQLPVHPSIHSVTVHVGVNSCPSGPVTEREWTDLIVACQKAFPHAFVRFSSILPARGRHNLNNTISPSNKYLATACEQQGVLFINNHSIFTALSGAPRLSLYKDATHPSAKGTAKLAVNLRLDSQPPGLSPTHPELEYHHSRLRDMYPRARHPCLNREKLWSDAIPNPHTPIDEQPPPPSVYHYPPLSPHSNSSIPTSTPPVLPWYPTEQSLAASADYTTRSDGPVHRRGNPITYRPPAFPPAASATPRPSADGPLHQTCNTSTCPPPTFPPHAPTMSNPGPAPGSIGPLHPLAVHFLNMAAQMCAQQTAAY